MADAMKRVLICGIDGYLGWPLAMHLASMGCEVYGIDNLSRRKNVKEVGSCSATPIVGMEARVAAARRILGLKIAHNEGDLREYRDVAKVVRDSKPDAIVHLGEQPSAPYSMIDQEHAISTQQNNVVGTLNLLFAMKEWAPDAHLVKLGTMGEYGTPDIDIPEGFFDVEFRGRKARLPFPRQAGSFYHLSKVHDSGNIAFACKIWGLRSTDVMQGVVYGTRTGEMEDNQLLTRFDFDECFGTVINRFCAQAVIGHPLTPYGEGRQKRGFIALTDSIKCLTIAIENPPDLGEYRVFNQLDEVYDIRELATLVSQAAARIGLQTRTESVENPRVEAEDHYYNVDRESLRNLGFRPTMTLDKELDIMLNDLLRFKSRIEAKRDVIAPRTKWRAGARSHEPVDARAERAPEPAATVTVS
jgi:UDP-sulfoquinovose synthase